MERACVVCCWHRGSSHVKTGFVRRRVRDKYPTGPPQLPSYFLAFCWLCLFVTFRLSFSRTSGKVRGIDINLSHENVFTVSFALIDFIRHCLARGGVLGSSQCSVFFASLRFLTFLRLQLTTDMCQQGLVMPRGFEIRAVPLLGNGVSRLVYVVKRGRVVFTFSHRVFQEPRREQELAWTLPSAAQK